MTNEHDVTFYRLFFLMLTKNILLDKLKVVIIFILIK